MKLIKESRKSKKIKARREALIERIKKQQPRGITQCPYCGSIVEYNNADLDKLFEDERRNVFDYYYTICPACKRKLHVPFLYKQNDGIEEAQIIKDPLEKYHNMVENIIAYNKAYPVKDPMLTSTHLPAHISADWRRRIKEADCVKKVKKTFWQRIIGKLAFWKKEKRNGRALVERL